jgi:BlaI family penicillinase repressor
MADPQPISESEAKVMQVLWDTHPLSAEQIFDALGKTETWQLATVKTLIGRLVRKGALGATAEGRRFLYYPILSHQNYVTTESRSLVDRLFNGRVAPLVSHFAEQRKLTKRDVAELRRLLDELDRG